VDPSHQRSAHPTALASNYTFALRSDATFLKAKITENDNWKMNSEHSAKKRGGGSLACFPW
jgi:hypothetical protein